MEIQFLKKDNTHQISMSGGWVSDTVRNYVHTALKAQCWNFIPKYAIDQREDFGNTIAICIENGRDTDVQEFCDYLNVILREAILPVFTEISVSPYSLPEYDDRGGLDLLRMISQETGCPVDWNEWMKPIVFKPISNVQYNDVIALLRTFQMKFHNYLSKEV